MNSRWNIELFGSLCVCRDEERIIRFATQKTATLLAYLAFHRTHSPSREVLIELLWPECELSAGRNRLSTLLSHLRHLLEPLGMEAGSVVQADSASVRLNLAAVTTDVAEFEDLLRTASRTEEAATRLNHLLRAVALYKDGLLPGSYEEWVGREQTRLRDRYSESLQELALAWEQNGEIETALMTIERAIEADAYREAAHRTRMRLQSALGRPAAVQESYQSLERLFREELGASPSAATRELAARLRADPRAVVTMREASRSLTPPAAAPLVSKRPSQDTGLLPEIVTPATLPLQMTRFFGRGQEMAQLQQLFAEMDARLVTVIGPGGAGKTRLAIETAGRLASTLHNRVWFVPLADLPDAHLLAYALARALKVSVTDAGDPLEPVLAFLNEAPCLLVLDNFEHLIREETPAAKGDQQGLDKGTALVRFLLERAPTLRCLVTSRRALRLSGEQEFPLASLPLPALSSSPEEVLPAASVSLYVDRAKQSRPDFALTPHNAHAVAQLCRRLEGMPLAIEMAAAWAKALPPAKMLERLEERLDALTSRRRDLPMRHQSLRATIDWSYDLLDAPQQRLLARLAVFRGGWSLEAAEAICSEDEADRGQKASVEDSAVIAEHEVLDLLTDLVEKSLVVSEEEAGEVRYRLLETVRQYSYELLKASGEIAAAQARHYAFFMNLAEISWDIIRTGEQIACLNGLEQEQDNLRAALIWSRTEVGRQACGHKAERERTERVCPCVEAELDLAGRLRPFWDMRGYWREGRQHLEAALRRDTAQKPTDVRARALLGIGVLAANMGDHVAARGYYEECLNIRRQLGDKQGVGSVALALGNIAREEGDFAATHRWYAESLEVARSLEDAWFIATVLNNLGVLASHENDPAAEQRCNEEALLLRRQLGDVVGIATVQHNLSIIFTRQQNLSAAYTALEESVTLLQQAGDKRIVVHALTQLAAMEREERPLGATRLFGAALHLMEEIGLRPNEALVQDLRELQEALGDEIYLPALAQGQAMGMEQSLAEALTIIREAPALLLCSEP